MHQHTATELMILEASALFTYDAQQRMRTINEPWDGTAAAPLFFLGRAADGGTICRFRHDVEPEQVEQMTTLAGKESFSDDIRAKPLHFNAYMQWLKGTRSSIGLSYLVPPTLTPAIEVVRVTPENITDFVLTGFEWLQEEVPYVQPCIAVVQAGRIVSTCRSVRIAAGVQEAGVDTHVDFRGNNYALAVVAGWAQMVSAQGNVPIYSTSDDNLSSQRVAAKLGLVYFGTTFTIS
ncbi:GNAT family N-acetyltransferase [Chitinophaga nivalis]|uniref:GNAT family N-acetyltransferase n=1 Tax=Chitinophaga nivalis TaxID=2991709 RepID=A0ABT3ITF8_9BACT|nr:GNAT family N-acetyltransferase [Chitinophaga nivalis]MCW3463038.1 GNAT family N-acetyltransferase [Chitinophaga nivalis]MCW3487272.1 GNAT family N-acetyltransferase [Chitinophaga nivalis]